MFINVTVIFSEPPDSNKLAFLTDDMPDIVVNRFFCY